ncbi:MAG: hypothetical protein ACFBSG_08115 [Leptolyngbyaceae cyanobacterium]
MADTRKKVENVQATASWEEFQDFVKAVVRVKPEEIEKGEENGEA